jgi:hypothetical protein
MESKSYSADNKGLRDDEGKPEFHLIPSEALSELGRVYSFGAKKYAPYNWERGMSWSRCFNSLLRHLFAYWDGEKNDPETGLNHMAHVTWNAIALLVYSLRGIGIDDRKASFLSAQQNKEASESTCEVERLKKSIFSPELKGLVDRDLPAVTNQFALAKRIDLKEQQPRNMRCYNCPNDAMPHHAVCEKCYDEAAEKGERRPR